MARKVALVIGVRKAGKLAELSAAIPGAHDFARWAGAAGYQVALITDEEQPVTVHRLKREVKAGLTPFDVEKLFVYFAGHGVCVGTDVDFWLLSNCHEDDDEAVNVAQSRRVIRSHGIGHVAFFADACRTADKRFIGVHGCTLFPRGHRTDPIELDQFYAARAGEAAQEVVCNDASRRKAFGIFTECLLTALEGRAPEAAEPSVRLNDHYGRAVTGHSLKEYIRDAVASRVLEVPGAANQEPDPRAESQPPNVLAVLPEDVAPHTVVVEVDAPVATNGPTPVVRVLTFDHDRGEFTPRASGPAPLEIDLPAGTLYRAEAEMPGFEPDPASLGIRPVGGTGTHRILLLPQVEAPATPPAPTRVRTVVVGADGSEHDTAPGTGVFRVTSADPLTGRFATDFREVVVGERPTPVPRLGRDDEAEQLVDRLASTRGRHHFETSTGLSILGARVVSACVGSGHAGLFEEDGAWHVRGFPPSEQERRGLPGTTSALIELEGDRFLATAMIGGYLGTITVDARQTDVVEWAAVHTTFLPALGSPPAAAGFDYERARRKLAEAAVAVRRGRFDAVEGLIGEAELSPDDPQAANPVLALFAAYARDMAGDAEGVRQMIGGFAEIMGAVPFDVALLAGLSSSDIGLPVAPSYPLLTQGWAYLDPDELHPALALARRTLARSPWAMPTGKGGRALAAALKDDDLEGELI